MNLDLLLQVLLCSNHWPQGDENDNTNTIIMCRSNMEWFQHIIITFVFLFSSPWRWLHVYYVIENTSINPSAQVGLFFKKKNVH